MSEISWLSWLLLFTPALFAFVVGGGFWVYCVRTTADLAEAGKRFKVNGWLIHPLAIVGLCWLLWSQLSDPIRQLGLGRSLNVVELMFAVLIGGVMAVFAELLNRRFIGEEIKPEDAAHMPVQWRELPSLVLVAPVGEELIFRGWGLFIFEPLGLLMAGVITTLAFALMHFKPAMIVMAFVGGILLFAAYALTGNLWLPILAHAVSNFSTWLLMRRKLRSATLYDAN